MTTGPPSSRPAQTARSATGSAASARTTTRARSSSRDAPQSWRWSRRIRAATQEATGVAFRFVSILGERYTHGHVHDFYRALKRDPDRLQVLGDGRQEKSYLYVGDCVAAISIAARTHEQTAGFTVYNLVGVKAPAKAVSPEAAEGF